MPNVMEGRTRYGGKRYCNARCHNAKGEKCKCVCDSMNHGVGHEQAQANVRAYRKKLMPELELEDDKDEAIEPAVSSADDFLGRDGDPY